MKLFLFKDLKEHLFSFTLNLWKFRDFGFIWYVNNNQIKVESFFEVWVITSNKLVFKFWIKGNIFHNSQNLIVPYLSNLRTELIFANEINNPIFSGIEPSHFPQNLNILFEPRFMYGIGGLKHHAIDFIFDNNIIIMNKRCNVDRIINKIDLPTNSIAINSNSSCSSPCEETWPSGLCIFVMIVLLILLLFVLWGGVFICV